MEDNTSVWTGEGNLSFDALFQRHPLVQAASWLNGLYLWLVFALGIAGNALVLAVQRRKGSSLRSADSALSVFICSLAVADSLMLAVAVPFWFLMSRDLNVSTLHDLLCRLIYYYNYVVGTSCSWLLVCMTSHRALSILFPHKMFSSARKAQLVVGGVVVFFLLFYAHVALGLTVQRLDTGQRVCGFVSREYRAFFGGPFLWMSIVVSSALPFLLLAACNGVIMWRVGRAVREARAKLAAGTEAQLRQRESKTAGMNVTLVCVSVSFMALTSPLYAFLLRKYVSDSVFSQDVEAAARNYFLDTLGNALWLTNNAINFYIYTLTGSRYRRELAAMCGCQGKAQGERATQATSFTS